MMKWKKSISWIIVISIMLLIFYFSSQETITSSSTSSGISNTLMGLLFKNLPIIFDNFHVFVRKVAHFGIYFLLGLSLYNALQQSFDNRKITLLLITIAIVLLYAISDEVHQLFVIGRSGEVRDVLVDTVGGSVGGLLTYFIFKMRCSK